MRTSKHFLMLVVAIVGGLGAAVTSALAQSGDDLQFLCYRNRTIQVPSYLVVRYIFKGATSGKCIVTP